MAKRKKSSFKRKPFGGRFIPKGYRPTAPAPGDQLAVAVIKMLGRVKATNRGQ
jgi:hypothetical protein